MKKTTQLKNLILDNEILVMPGAHDVLTAKVIQDVGFKAVTLGGYASTAALLGRPDGSFLTLTEMADYIGNMADAVDIPLLADGDTGHGGVLNVQRTVKKLEMLGAAGMFIEDQLFPKRCGHMEGKQVVEKEEMIAKIKAALDVRKDDDFIMMARTDALAVHGLDDAIERVNLYREAGADMVFIEAPTTKEEMIRINREVDAPTLANNIEGGKTPLLSAKELEEIGYNVVVFPVASTYAIKKAVTGLMTEIKNTGSSKGFLDNMVTFDEFNKFMGLEEMRELELSFYK
ncbi:MULTISPECIES: isocitrate lyase/PEP mutase family protein [Desulfobacula]|uniref:2-methylisocitrate lyase n=2 Tax=Desulfobacula TaxID=28222 RepID=K0NKR7_DESTT|nr:MULTISPECIES: oxaloacetate decarboxylase [Desulfobacula]CCK81375.1 PrpB: predicted methylisocitrate lyase [Desulfobacula toluolica Tol2]SDU27650.1 2,3-dimethylmalate lyase [Desulfobacula phenolica]